MLNVKKYGGIVSKGVIATFAPSILKGALVGLFKARNVDVKKATQWVLADKSLWDSLEPERKRQFKQIASKLGNLNFITTDWAIDALREDYPAVASLFLGWTKGRNWMARQMEIIKAEIY